MKNIFKHLDLKTLLTCYHVSEEFRNLAILRFKELPEFSDDEWLNVIDTTIPEDVIDILKDQIIRFDYLFQIIDYRKLSEDFIRKHFKYIEMKKACKFVKLSEDFIRKYRLFVDWEKVCKYQDLSVDFIKANKDYVDWMTLINNNKIPTEHYYSMMYQYRKEIEMNELYWFFKDIIDRRGFESDDEDEQF